MKWFPIARLFVLGTLIFGSYAHITNLIFGTDLMLSHVMTPIVDSLFVLPMALGAFAVVAARNEYDFRNRLEKAVVIFTAIYFTASLPLHMRTWFTQNTDLFRSFPVWYSAIFLVYTAFMQFIWWNLKPKTLLAAV